MDDIIEKVNSLQVLCVDIQNPINIPQIVVIGAQSSGKSSILENIVGREILPRGTGMVTRRPLMIQIVNTEGEEHCTFGHAQSEVFSFESAQAEIQRETDRILENKNDVSAIPIVLRVYKRSALPLTLIDLPGLVKVQSDGQPEGIVKKIEELVRSYVQNANTIILAVSPASTDIASSDALMMAREVDPDFERTLCVLTKVDLMDPGTDIVNVLQGKVIKTKLGFIPVICRGELSLKSKVQIKDALDRERRYFQDSPAYTKNRKFCGIPYLITRLNDILKKNIGKSTAYLQDRISFLLRKMEKELQEMGSSVKDERQMVMQMITEFRQELDRKVAGTPKANTKHLAKEIVDGARISYTLDTLFFKSVQSLDLFDATDTEIENVMHNTSGVFGGVSSTQSLYHFMAQAVDRARPHCLQVSTKVFLEMQSMMECILGARQLERFPRLKAELCRSSSALLKERLGAANSSIKEFLQWNATYIRPVPASAGSPNVICAGVGQGPSISPEIELLKRQVLQQIQHLKGTITDQVPKIVIFEVVHKTMNMLQQRLIEDIYTLESIPALLQEEESAKEKRESLQRSILSLEKAHAIASTL
ncbi:vacuolar protein sorting-associated protein 1 [Nematocida major]|uniref:vacuolar protein sorting-associated protein 1 n=1 Tax=Nematocida major TaxID=1912982 RepID=UPI00200794AA|nr:vacuolar protein sorting-associated protein 1 [Nematocida major]KAH9387162.1 vacuolar protein sorting-associated protein 1 [Nematocida major]